jgi:TolB-like protein
MASKLSVFLSELKRRKVYHVGIAYVVVGASIIEVASNVLRPTDWDQLRLPIVVLVLVGFPIALVLAWAYEVKPEEPRGIGAPAEGHPPPRGTTPAAETTTSEKRKSIIVLPFANMSPDPGDAYFADGLTEEIIAHLSHVRSMRVISRNSAMVLKGTPKDTRTIAQDLDVQYVLEGSVRKAGEDLRITAQLIEAEIDTHLWAESYAGTIGDIFQIQEEVSRSIVTALKVELSPRENRKIGERPIADIKAYECYLKAYQEIFQYTEESFTRAVRLLQNGLEIVGENELLFEAMGNAHLQQVNFMIQPEQRFLDEAEEWAKKILDLDPESAQGLFLSALIQWKRGFWREGIARLKEASSLEENYPRPLEYLVYLHALAGKGDTAREYLPKLMELEPLIPLYHCFPGWIKYLEGDFDAAVEPIRKFHSMEPESPYSTFILLSFLTRLQRSDEAFSLVGVLEERAPQDPFTVLALARKHALKGDPETVRGLVTPEFAKAARWDEQFSWEVAANYALIGEEDEALTWLENAVNRGFINYPFLHEMDPLLSNLRGGVRFEDLMARVRQEWQSFEG